MDFQQNTVEYQQAFILGISQFMAHTLNGCSREYN
jgi:undecaprenyl pyrophosphate phosphatase UppP